jgi:hypothetical protein
MFSNNLVPAAVSPSHSFNLETVTVLSLAQNLVPQNFQKRFASEGQQDRPASASGHGSSAT